MNKNVAGAYALASIIFGLPFVVLGWIAAEICMAAKMGFKACVAFNNGTLLQGLAQLRNGE